MNQCHFGGKLSSSLYYAVPDPDLEMGGGGGGGPGRAPPPPPPPPLDPPLLQILSKNVVVVEASSQMSGKKTDSLILPFSVQRK